MSTSHHSPFERLLVHEKQRISVYIRLYHRNYTPAFPATHLLSLIPLPSKLSLRLVSTTTKAWIDTANPSVFSNLRLLFPLNNFSAEQISALHNIFSHCTHLTITLSEAIQIRNPTDALPLPPLPHVQHLTLTAPTHRPFQPLLSVRLALQRATLPHLTHLSLSKLSLPSILALRFGSFTSYGDASSSRTINIWQSLEQLDVHMLGWWENEKQEDYNSDNPTTPQKKESWRTSTRVLHDFLHALATTAPSLSTISFSWTSTSPSPAPALEGPNPFLLDTIVTADGSLKNWFSAPPIHWPSLTHLSLGNIVVSAPDVEHLKQRMRGLENVTVMPHCLDHGLGGKGVVRDGRVWVELDVGGERMGGCGDGEGEQEAEKRVRGSWRRGEEGGGRERDRVSMVLPFMLDLETGEEGGEGGEGGEL